MKCDRCNEEINSWSTSFLNTDTICLKCQEKEKDHPLFELAKNIEQCEVRKGNYNFKGILYGLEGTEEEKIIMAKIKFDSSYHIAKEFINLFQDFFNVSKMKNLVKVLLKNNIHYYHECLSWVTYVASSDKNINEDYVPAFQKFILDKNYELTPATGITKILSEEDPRIQKLYSVFCKMYLSDCNSFL